MPAFALWTILTALGDSRGVHLVIASLAVVPCYVMFAIALLLVSPVVTRLMGWRTPVHAEMRIADMDWALLKWARYAASNHMVRIFAGTLFRGSPLWTLHLRLSGARLGTSVYINSLSLNDYNLLEFGDGVVIGADVHLSGHTVEAGIVKTAGARLGSGTTVGVGTIVEIGVETGPNCQIGALSFVPKHIRLSGNAVYAGIPAMRIS